MTDGQEAINYLYKSETLAFKRHGGARVEIVPSRAHSRKLWWRIAPVDR